MLGCYVPDFKVKGSNCQYFSIDKIKINVPPHLATRDLRFPVILHEIETRNQKSQVVRQGRFQHVPKLLQLFSELAPHRSYFKTQTVPNYSAKIYQNGRLGEKTDIDQIKLLLVKLHNEWSMSKLYYVCKHFS